MGRFASSTAAAAAQFLKTASNLDLQRKMGALGVQRQLIEKLASMELKPMPSLKLGEGKATVILNPEDYERMKFMTKVYSEFWEKLDGEMAKEDFSLEKYMEIGSRWMVVMSMVETGMIGLGGLIKFSTTSEIIGHFLSKFSGEYETDTSELEKLISSKIALLAELTKAKGLPTGGDLSED